MRTDWEWQIWYFHPDLCRATWILRSMQWTSSAIACTSGWVFSLDFSRTFDLTGGSPMKSIQVIAKTTKWIGYDIDFENEKKKEKSQVLPRFELGSWDSESQVLTVTPQNQHINVHLKQWFWIMHYLSEKGVKSSSFTKESSIGASTSKLPLEASLLVWRDGMGSSEWCAGRGGVKKYGCRRA